MLRPWWPFNLNYFLTAAFISSTFYTYVLLQFCRFKTSDIVLQTSVEIAFNNLRSLS